MTSSPITVRRTCNEPDSLWITKEDETTSSNAYRKNGDGNGKSLSCWPSKLILKLRNNVLDSYKNPTSPGSKTQSGRLRYLSILLVIVGPWIYDYVAPEHKMKGTTITLILTVITIPWRSTNDET